ncbi:MAG: DUF6134 family protein [Methylococcus sp.]
MKQLNYLLLTLLLLASAPLARATLGGAERDWRFTVYLDDDPVGHHSFTLTESEALRKLRSEARFTVKLLMIKAYGYEHEAEETWRGDCLNALKASTDDNGEKIAVVGSEKNGRFEIKKGTQAETLPSCVMTFAYWNPLILKQSKLLNPQNGEYLNVRIQPQGRETVAVKGKPVAADKYHLDAGKFQIDLWYADGGRWVALDSHLDNGRTLRYRIE